MDKAREESTKVVIMGLRDIRRRRGITALMVTKRGIRDTLTRTNIRVIMDLMRDNLRAPRWVERSKNVSNVNVLDRI